jgi:hypothetical protein
MFLLYSHHIQYQIKPSEKASSPFYAFIAFVIVYVLAANWNARPAIVLSKVIDIVLLIAFGIGGLLVLYMSQFSMHTACHENYNLFWLHPFYLIALITYFVSRKSTGYLGWIFFGMIIAFMLGNYFIPQHFSKEVIAVISLALVLSIRLIKRGRDARFQ